MAKAAKLAKLDTYYTSDYPQAPDMLSQLLSGMEENHNNYLDEKLHDALGELYEPVMLLRDINHHNAIQARIPFIPNIR